MDAIEGSVLEFECDGCSTRHRAGTVTFSYGFIVCRTAVSDEPWVVAQGEPSCGAIAGEMNTIAGYQAVSESCRGEVSWSVLQLLVDQPRPGDWLLVGVDPRCPNCGLRRSSVVSENELSACQIPLARFETWLALEPAHRRRVLQDALDTVVRVR